MPADVVKLAGKSYNYRRIKQDTGLWHETFDLKDEQGLPLGVVWYGDEPGACSVVFLLQRAYDFDYL